MSDIPAMPVFTDALIAATTHLSAEEYGAYVRILIATWEKGCRWFPDIDRVMARVTGVPARRWRLVVRPVLVDFFDLSGGFFVQKRVKTEWDFVTRDRNQKVQAGIASAEAKRLKKQQTTSTAVDEPLPTAVPTNRPTKGQRNVNSSTSIRIEEEESKEERTPIPPAKTDQSAEPAATTEPVRVAKPSAINHAPEMYAIWHELFHPIWPRSRLTPEIAATLNLRFADEFKTLDRWRDFCEFVRECPHLIGETSGWRASLAWICKPSSIQKINNGDYERRSPQGYPGNVNGNYANRNPSDTLVASMARALAYTADAPKNR
jgi:uncharacterized protein YdaU (DUF1376 family)